MMNKNKDEFFGHDEDRFLKYLDDVESGTEKQISGATLLPHSLAMEAVQLYRRKAPGYVDTTHSLGNALKE